MPEPPRTDEGWYVLHDFRTVNWAAWRAAPDERTERALSEGVEYLTAHEDPEEGWSAVFSVLGHKADVMVLHLRPTTSELDVAERQFEQTTLADYTTQVASYVSVTEASGYSESAREYFEERESRSDSDGATGEQRDPGAGETENTGLQNYIESRIYPDLPDAEHVCFYPMDKRRGEEDNWYDLPFDERAELMSAHGDIGRGYAGRVKQIISGSVGLDDYEWGVTLFADDPTDIKDLLYEMRFDPSSSKYAEFGQFYFGRRFPPADLPALLAGEAVPTGEHGEESADDSGLAARLSDLGVSLDAPEGAYAVLVHTEADADEVREAVDGLRGNFEHYDSHVETRVESTDEGCVVVSTWTTESAADTASGFLADLPGATETSVGALGGGAGDAEPTDAGEDFDDDIRAELTDLDIYAGKPHGEDVYAMVLYSETDVDELLPKVEDLRDGFDRYDTHVRTAVYEGRATDRAAIVSLWETQSAADTAGGFLGDLPGIVARADEESGFGTMGMFYTVKPEHREEFVEKFDTVGSLLEDMDGHYETDLMVDAANENDMFIASQWRSKEDAMGFFRSDAFRDTVQWGRDILADRPRHVFLA